MHPMFGQPLACQCEISSSPATQHPASCSPVQGGSGSAVFLQRKTTSVVQGSAAEAKPVNLDQQRTGKHIFILFPVCKRPYRLDARQLRTGNKNKQAGNKIQQAIEQAIEQAIQYTTQYTLLDRDALVSDVTMYVCETYHKTVGLYNKTLGNKSIGIGPNLVNEVCAKTYYGFTVGSVREYLTKRNQCVAIQQAI